MDVFDLRQRVIGEYADDIRRFFTIRDTRIKEKVDVALAEGHIWPDPLLQLSAAFEPRESIRHPVIDVQRTQWRRGDEGVARWSLT